jgi:hypothetical protein
MRYGLTDHEWARRHRRNFHAIRACARRRLMALRLSAKNNDLDIQKAPMPARQMSAYGGWELKAEL